MYEKACNCYSKWRSHYSSGIYCSKTPPISQQMWSVSGIDGQEKEQTRSRVALLTSISRTNSNNCSSWHNGAFFVTACWWYSVKSTPLNPNETLFKLVFFIFLPCLRWILSWFIFLSSKSIENICFANSCWALLLLSPWGCSTWSHVNGSLNERHPSWSHKQSVLLLLADG